MAKTVNFNMRIEKSLKDDVNQILENYGMTVAQALRMFLVNVQKTKKIPLNLDYQADELVLNENTSTADNAVEQVEEYALIPEDEMPF